MHDIGFRVDAIDFGPHSDDALGNESIRRLNRLLRCVRTEGQEEIPRLIMVHVAGLNDGDLPFGLRQHRPQFVDGHGARGARTEDEEALHDFFLSTTAAAMRGRESSTRLR